MGGQVQQRSTGVTPPTLKSVTLLCYFLWQLVSQSLVVAFILILFFLGFVVYELQTFCMFVY